MRSTKNRCCYKRNYPNGQVGRITSWGKRNSTLTYRYNNIRQYPAHISSIHQLDACSLYIRGKGSAYAIVRGHHWTSLHDHKRHGSKHDARQQCIGGIRENLFHNRIVKVVGLAVGILRLVVDGKGMVCIDAGAQDTGSVHSNHARDYEALAPHHYQEIPLGNRLHSYRCQGIFFQIDLKEI